MTNLGDVQDVVSKYGYTADRASLKYARMFEGDLDEADMYDLGRTWRQDWKAELYATLANSEATFCVFSENHDGAAIFGATPAGNCSAQIWLLQSKSFTELALLEHGKSWPFMAMKMTHEVVQLFLKSNSPVFNFISRKQEHNISG